MHNNGINDEQKVENKLSAYCSCVHQDMLLRESKLLQLIPISHSTLWSWVRSGKFPQPLRLGGRVTVWRWRDVRRLIDGETNISVE